MHAAIRGLGAVPHVASGQKEARNFRRLTTVNLMLVDQKDSVADKYVIGCAAIIQDVRSSIGAAHK